MKARLARTLAVGALSGAGSEAALAELLRKGLLTLVRLRTEAHRMDPSGTLLGCRNTRFRLPYGATGRLHISGTSTLLGVTARTGSDWSTQDAKTAGQHLARRCSNNLDAAMRVVLAIERARKACCGVFEEATRWLPSE